ncbi:M23 family metallopeptidase [sulfur-oxidizing endosymbiont of Gigantopelta aegis]|uniref:M23 family metallopeptidase n=1 Tax=sulfur-oxidizing endosymbiont of Gigantopelta aegis TaxID=2794934 RepID=UPI00248449EC|nr:M23 family metallopeptidase [sulfur-oxidizing endosymbiont of Gigantopelta aegis]
MNIIFVRKRSGATIDIDMSRSFIVVTFLLLLSIPVVSYYLGVISNDHVPSIADLDKPENVEPIRAKLNQIIGSLYKEELARQQEELDSLKQHNQENINALTNSLARLQAHIIRLDALGKRLTEVAELDENAFNFDFEPSMGGPIDSDVNKKRLIESVSAANQMENIKYSEFVKRMAQVTQDIDNRTKQLSILESLLIAEHFSMVSTPTGKPAEKGWVSSFFGKRKDPFTGKKRMHKGVDVAGKSGSYVLATADGIVTRAESQSGYGKLIEIDHGYKLSTRYGHNKTVAVKVGDVVKQGQIIATMGSTGRSTGPHVHYEVLRNGRQVNPQKFINTVRK